MVWLLWHGVVVVAWCGCCGMVWLLWHGVVVVAWCLLLLPLLPSFPPFLSFPDTNTHLLRTQGVSGGHEVSTNHGEGDGVAVLCWELHTLLELVLQGGCVKAGVVWCGVVWCGVVWWGVVW